MKKILFTALIAIVCLACGPQNGPDVPNKDKNALKVATVDLASMFKQDSAKVNKVLINAGFMLKGYTSDPEPVLAHNQAPRKNRKIDSENTEFKSYEYGFPANSDSMTVSEMDAYQRDHLAKGGCLISAYVMYVDGVFAGVEVAYAVGLVDKINLLYTEISDKLYALLPTNATESKWQGILMDKDYKELTDHNEYVTAVTAAISISAIESAYGVTSAMEGIQYQCEWINPDEAMQADMIEEIGTPMAMGIFEIQAIEVN